MGCSVPVVKLKWYLVGSMLYKSYTDRVSKNKVPM